MLYICLEGNINEEGIGAIFNDNPLENDGKDLVKKGRGFVFTCPYAVLATVFKQPFKKIMEGKQRVMKTLKKAQKATLSDYMLIRKLRETDLG